MLRKIRRFLVPFFVPAAWDVWGWFTTYIPVIAGLTTAGLGHIQGIPWMWLTVGGALTFAGTSAGALRFSQWRERSRVWGKLYFADVVWAIDWNSPPPAANQLEITAVQYRIVLVNSADFPIFFRFNRVRSGFAGRMQADPIVTEGVVMPGRPSTVSGQRIPISPTLPVRQGSIEQGEFLFEIFYGRKPSRCFNRIGHRIRPELAWGNSPVPELRWAYAEDRSEIVPGDW